LSGASLVGTNLEQSELDFARLNSANLTDANLRAVLLLCTSLRNADLHRANLANANLTCANLTGARGLTREQLFLAVGHALTCPPGMMVAHPRSAWPRPRRGPSPSAGGARQDLALHIVLVAESAARTRPLSPQWGPERLRFVQPSIAPLVAFTIVPVSV